MKGIPKKEIQWMTIRVDNVEKFVVTSNQDRTLYYLYEKGDDGFIKKSKSKNPTDFDKLIFNKGGRSK